jgi:hypothetical protein
MGPYVTTMSVLPSLLKSAIALDETTLPFGICSFNSGGRLTAQESPSHLSSVQEEIHAARSKIVMMRRIV